MLKFFLISLIVGSGIIIGAILSIIAKEELKQGKRYFLFLKTTLFSAVILITSFYYFSINLLVSFLVLLLFSAIFIKKFQAAFMYLSFSLAYILSYADKSLYILVSSLIFFAGFPIGTLGKKKILRRIIIPYLVFIAVSFLTFAISYV